MVNVVILVSPVPQAGQPELIALEKALKAAMVPAGNAREVTAPYYINSDSASDFPI